MMQKKNRTRRLPHDKVYTRIKCSPIHGVGVFAILPIPKGTPLFGDDDDELRWVGRAELGHLPREINRLYTDFCIAKDKGKWFGCPRSFNDMTIAWYLNDSRNANVGCDKNYRFHTLRDVKKGEELTVDYRTYNDSK